MNKLTLLLMFFGLTHITPLFAGLEPRLQNNYQINDTAEEEAQLEAEANAEINLEFACQNKLVKVDVKKISGLQEDILEKELSRSEKKQIIEMKKAHVFDDWASIPAGQLARVQGNSFTFLKIANASSNIAEFAIEGKQYSLILSLEKSPFRIAGQSETISLKAEEKGDGIVTKVSKNLKKLTKNKWSKRTSLFLIFGALGYETANHYDIPGYVESEYVAYKTKDLVKAKEKAEHDSLDFHSNMNALLKNSLENSIKAKGILDLLNSAYASDVDLSVEDYKNILDNIPENNPESLETDVSIQMQNEMNNNHLFPWGYSQNFYATPIQYKATKLLVRSKEFKTLTYEQRLEFYNKTMSIFHSKPNGWNEEYNNNLKEFYFKMIVNKSLKTNP